MRDLFHILNPNRFRQRAVHNFIVKNPTLESIWVDRTQHPTHLETVVEWAVNEGRSEIAVWGGDGTLSRVVQKLFEMEALSAVKIALIPTGTCNDFARSLRLPHWKQYLINAQTSVAFDVQSDIGVLEGPATRRAFVNNAGFGRTFDASRKKSNPVKDIFSFTPKRLDLRWDDGASQSYETRDALLAVICNGGYFNKGLCFKDNVRIDDKTLNAFFEVPQSRWSLLAKFVKGRLGQSLATATTLCIDAQKITVKSDHDLYAQVDGEPVGETATRHMTFSVLPQALKLLVWR